MEGAEKYERIKRNQDNDSIEAKEENVVAIIG